MTSVLISVLATLRGTVRSPAVRHLEVLALRHQLQNAYAERLIGPARRESLDHIIINERGLHRFSAAYVEYYLSRELT
jgi:hypothetical protein